MSKSNQHRGLTVCVLFAAIAQVLWPAVADAQNLPSGMVGSPIDGPGTTNVETSGNTMTVTLGGPRTIINWDSFDVGTGYTFEVIGLSASDILLNRVLGGTASSIDGLVQSNANVWIFNPNGITISANGRFDVGGLMLSTSGVADADFLDGDLEFDLSGNSPNGINVQAGAQLSASSGGIYLLADFVGMAGSMQSPGTNALIGARGVSVTFDADLSAITTLDVGIGSDSAEAVRAGFGASMGGSRNLIMAAGMTTNKGNVILYNPNGATDIQFTGGSVELVSRDASVKALGTFTTPGDLTVTAAQMFQGNGAPTVGGDYSITAEDFSGGVFNPVFIGTDNTFSITDTSSLTIGNISAPGDLTVSAAGSLSVNGAFGSQVSVNGDITLTSGDSITLQGNLTTSAANSVRLDAAGSITQSSGVITTGTLQAQAGTGLSLIGNNSWQAASLWGGTYVQARAAGNWTLLDAFSGGSYLYLTGPSITVAGDVEAALDLVFDADVVIGADVALESHNAGVTFHGTVDGSGALAVSSATGTVFNADVGANGGLSRLVVEGDSTFNGSTLRTINAMELDDVTIGGTSPTFTIESGALLDAGHITAANSSLDVVSNGRLRAASIVAGDHRAGNLRSLHLDANGGSIELGTVAASSIHAIANDLQVSGGMDTFLLTGALDGQAMLYADNRIGSIGAFESEGLFLRNLGSLLVQGVVDGGAGDVTIEVVDENLQIDASGAVLGRNIALSANSFLNNSGADALSASGHWVVYQDAPGTAADYDGLDSGNTALWGASMATLAPSSVSGNRYVFAYRPTLTFTTIDASKTYGTDLAGATDGLFTVSGLHPGVAGAFLADTAATAFSGAPLVTSAGFAERASVAGGPYAIEIANGTLASGSGYQFAFDGAGKLTVDPKAITGTATTTTKTYDGTPDASGSIVLSGVVAGDTVGASGTFTFVDKNAGLGKTVTVTGATLTGTDAGNYTLTVPATTIGDILQKAITGSATVDTKTYDGTTDASGTITLTGVVAGDDLGADGTFAFTDENAGTDKEVTLSAVALTGADAGNYTLTIPGSLLGDILRKAITGTVTVGNKTYDGTTGASGTVALDGVLAGDDVSGSAIVTFSDENAGTGKTVTVSGAALSGADAGNYTVTLPASALADILQKALTGTATVATKTYDGTTDASGTVALDGVVAGDDVSGSATFTFVDKHAGTGKAVTVSGGALAGADAGNYTLDLPTSVLGDILQKAITGTATASSKTYDGTTDASGTVALDGVVAGDDVAGSATFSFVDKHAGTGKTVTVSGATLSGADAGNYVVTLPATVLADILQKAITGTVTANDKTYDGTTAGTGTVALDGVVAGDDVAGSANFTFADKNAGADKTVTVSGATLSGADAGNYTVTLPATVMADILRKAITGTVAANDKTYDGTTTGSGSVALDGVVTGDDVDGTATFTFADKNAGTGKTVTVSGATLSGADAGNYTVTLPATVLADILQKAITGTVTANDKTYDGTTAATGSVTLDGVVAGDDVDGSATFTFSDKNAGIAKTVTVSGASLSGADAGNYTVTLPGSTVADILRRAITVTADAQSKEEGSEDPALTYEVTQGSLVAGDALSGNLTRAPGEAPGEYAIGQGTLDASQNYLLTFVGSTLTITEAAAGPTDPTDGIVVRDQVAGVVRFLLGLTAANEPDAALLDIVDERMDCDPEAEGAACQASRRD